MPDGLVNPFLNPFTEEALGLKGIFNNTESTSSTLKRRSGSFDSSVASSSSSRGLSIFTGLNPQPSTYTGAQSGSMSCSQHPLRSAAISNGFADTGVTRPHLKRVLTTRLIDLEGQREDEDPDYAGLEKAEEKAVLVHKVAQNDSLAGVALKYGINISDLRRANHLWASDSIHLRKELYIPLDKVSRLQVTPASQPVPSQTSGTSTSAQVPNEELLVDDSLTSDQPLADIRKIPIKHLSFFPPSAKPSKTGRDGPLIPEILEESNQHSRLTPSISLNTILNALPVAASTRDSIMARLSFDSTSSSYNEHELDDVRIGRHARSMSHDGVIDDHSSTSKAQKSSQPRVLKKSRGKPKTYDINLKSMSPQDVTAYPMTSPNTTSSSPDITFPVPVRTVQMEPSPTMHLPSSVRSKTVGADSRREKRRPRLIDVDFDLNGNASPSD
ncbi:hypothetical protein L218DRAFT_1005587 [Marasmius fiardii PR-910]|nr:hypothetical protein L218DRAFT_1005587 [Marasmius fiardii PR-910]